MSSELNSPTNPPPFAAAHHETLLPPGIVLQIFLILDNALLFLCWTPHNLLEFPLIYGYWF